MLRTKKLFAALLVSGIMFVGFTAAASPASASAVRCEGAVAVYSADRWQWARFDICTRKENSTVYYSVVAKDIEYYWGGAWYSNKYAVNMQADVVLQRDGRTVDSASRRAGGSSSSLTIDGSFNAGAPGAYRVSVQGALSGSYWSNYNSSTIITSPFSADLIIG